MGDVVSKPSSKNELDSVNNDRPNAGQSKPSSRPPRPPVSKDADEAPAASRKAKPIPGYMRPKGAAYKPRYVPGQHNGAAGKKKSAKNKPKSEPGKPKQDKIDRL